MSISKAVIMGKAIRNPEKRFTSNNVPITFFAIDIENNEENPSLVRIIAKGKLAEAAAEKVKKGKTVIVEGRLQNNTVKTNSGVEQKVVEIDAQSLEVMGESTQQAGESATVNESFDEEIINDDLIGEDEIPF